MRRPWSRWTIQGQIVAALAVGMILVLTAFAVTTSIGLRTFLQLRVESQLSATVNRTAASLKAVGGMTLGQGALGDFTAPNGRNVLVALDETGAVIAYTGIDAADAQRLAAEHDNLGTARPVPHLPHVIARNLDTRNLGLALTINTRTTPVAALVIGTDTRDDEATATQATWTNVIGAFIGILLLITIAVLVVGRGLRPLRRMASEAQAVATGEADRRLSADVADPAMRRLAETVNAAFDAQQHAEAHLRAFVADASHELRTPLTVTAGWIELYLQGGLEEPGPREEAMRRASRQLDRMRTLVDDLALLTRLDEHRPLEYAQVDLARLARETVEDARVIDPERHIVLLTPGPALVHGDEGRLYQVMRNLIGNALNHTPTASEVTVEIITGSDRAPHMVRVSDQGPGMPPEQVHRAFDRFWRGDASRSRQTGGSGLGLSIVRSIVEAHGGEVRLRSAPETGTVVDVSLPIS